MNPRSRRPAPPRRPEAAAPPRQPAPAAPEVPAALRNHALEIAVRATVRRRWIAPGAIEKVARSAVRGEGFRYGLLSIAVVGRAAMTSLHDRYSGIATPTDVLTFDLGCDPAARRIDGEIVVCADVAETQSGITAAARAAAVAEAATAPPAHPARAAAALLRCRAALPRCCDAPAQRRAALAELALYVVHGVLHLAGYDDHSTADYQRMHAREDQILRRLGWGPVFARQPH